MNVYRACLGCGEPTPERRCPDCQTEIDQRTLERRGTAAARGYDTKHRKLRARWARRVAAGTVSCWRCGDLIDAVEPWDLGHDDDDRTVTRGPEHAGRCNRRAGGAAAHGKGRRRSPQAPPVATLGLAASPLHFAPSEPPAEAVGGSK
jgi:hypothetical protein